MHRSVVGITGGMATNYACLQHFEWNALCSSNPAGQPLSQARVDVSPQTYGPVGGGGGGMHGHQLVVVPSQPPIVV